MDGRFDGMDGHSLALNCHQFSEKRDELALCEGAKKSRQRKPAALSAFRPRTAAVDNVVPKVGKNFMQVRDTLPGFVCSERIASRAFEIGKRIKQKVIDSIFTETRKMASARNKTSFDNIVKSRDRVIGFHISCADLSAGCSIVKPSVQSSQLAGTESKLT
jgi:hypothetical protein